MKSVGESMAIGRTFKEAFQKGCARSRRDARLDVAPRLADDRIADETIESCAARCASRHRTDLPGEACASSRA
jgi:hypothetical protein